MKKFKFINNVTGWVVFAIAAAVYILTIEPTASFWDCGEFISSAFKLEVGHPPGAPFFMLMGKIASLFAGNNVLLVPKMVNTMSALASGFCILFLFWTITHLARKIIGNKEEYTTGELIGIIGSGIVGALAYTFSDSFWFSAVEGEVYASSSLFTALVFWAVLKWEDVADQKYANRWLVLIAYLMGLSIGVHLLNLLAIPAIVLVYYFKKYKATPRGITIAILTSFAILAFVMYGMIQGIITVASWFELLFVNTFNAPYRSGLIFLILALFAFIVIGLVITQRKGKPLWHTIILCFAVILLGYSSYAAVIIRSQANTPMDQNNPETMFNLLSYLNREQYGDRPLLYGPYYNSPIRDVTEGKPIYAAKDGKYVKVGSRQEYKYDEKFETIFPRMFSREHSDSYKQWVSGKGTPIQTTSEQGNEPITLNKPTFLDNLEFFFSYQVNYMYIRYFMWNFSGRQNDIQGHGGILKGQWITGINFIDQMRLGPQDNLPKSLASNKARNKYYMLPFILGILGLLFQAQRNKKDFWTVMLLFFMTGLAIVLYLNQTPLQPRERDYAYSGSFYAYAIWIGLGVLGLINSFSKKTQALPAIFVTLLSLVLVPGIMASENWDDHDRSNRYTCRDFAYNYLNSCDKNAIIFTNGDNDTFPLWYAQEVENIRTDVRVVNMSYLGADWYIEQMQRKAYESDPLPFSMTRDKYIAGTRDMLYVIERVKDYTDLKEAMDFVASDNEQTKSYYGQHIDYLPAKKLKITVDSAAVLKSGTVSPQFAKSIVPEMRWELKRDRIFKNDMMVLDLLANNNWKRPVYFAITVSDENYQGLEKYFRLDGLAYRIVPIESNRQDGQNGSVDTKILYENLIHKFKWGGIDNPKVYLDENNMRMLMNFRNNFSRLSEALLAENKVDSAVKVLNKCLEIMPPKLIPINYYALPLIDQFYQAKQTQTANKLINDLYANTLDDLKYYFRMKGNKVESVDYEKRFSLQILQELMKITQLHKQDQLFEKISKSFQEYYSFYQQTSGGIQ
jgi:hypothetical protein